MPEKTDPHDEWLYAYHERLGMICEDREPTDEQDLQARLEAEAWVKRVEQMESE